MYRLTKKGVPWVWGTAQQKAFETVKDEMEREVYLTGIDYNFPIYVQCDASDIAVGACLKQLIDGKERIVECRSALLNESQRKWITYEKECFAIVWSLRKFKDLIAGQKIIVETDNKAVTWMRRNPSKRAKVERWSIELEEYDYELRHIKGKDNVMADMLSRGPPPPGQQPDQLLDDIAEGEHVPCLNINVLCAYVTRDGMVTAQGKDDECRVIMKTLVNLIAPLSISCLKWLMVYYVAGFRVLKCVKFVKKRALRKVSCNRKRLEVFCLRKIVS